MWSLSWGGRIWGGGGHRAAAINKKPRRVTKGEHLYAHTLGNLSLEFLEKINLIKLETHPHSVEKRKLIHAWFKA